MKTLEAIYVAKGTQEKANVAILYSDKVYFKPKLVERVKGSHYIMVKETIQQEEMKINMYAPHNDTPDFIKQVLLNIKKHRHTNTILVGDLNISLSH